MPITLGLPPRNGGDLLAAPLAHLLAKKPDNLKALGGEGAPVPPKPMAIYRLGLAEAASGEPLSAIVPIGWRYLIHDGAGYAAADIRVDGAGGEPEFDSLIRGRLPIRLVSAAMLAHDMYEDRQGRFEARVLEIPSIYRIALWLHGPTDVFFPVIEGGMRDERPIAPDDGFLTRIQADAAREIAANGVPDALE